jgi:hypothetical protein
MTWHLYVIDATGARVAELDDYAQATIIPRFLAIGAWRLEAARTPAAELLLLDGYGIQFVRDTTVVLSGPVRERVREYRATAEGFVDGYTFTGPDELVYLADRLAHPQPAASAPPYSSTAYDVRTGVASTILRQYVDVNAGPSAIAARRVTGLTLGADPVVGTSITGRARWQNLFDLLVELATIAGVGFRLADRTFEVYDPVDRSATVKLSVALGSLRGVTYTERASRANYVVVGGGGEGTARTIVEDSVPTEITRWGRIETFVDRRDTTNTTELGEAADGALEDGAAVRGFKLDLAETEATTPFADYNLGDLVSVTVDGVEFTDVVRELNIVLGRDGETITPTVGDPTADPTKPRIFDAVARALRAVRNLERR